MSVIAEVRVATVDNADRVRDRLSFEFGFLAQQGFGVSLDEKQSGDIVLFTCRLENKGSVPPADLKTMFHHHLANALSDLVVNDWEKAILMKLIKTHYESFSQGEQRAILSSASRSLDFRADGRPDLFRRIERKGRVLRLILDYLSTQQEINIDGFITFRLREYQEQLNEAVGQAVDDFLMEREYLEFINLLRYFVESQEPKLRLVHALILPKSAFKLMDDTGTVVTNEFLAESFLDVDTDVNSEDLLVSALITIAPERIILHCPAELDTLEALETIRSVFEGRVSTCRGCRLCRAARKDTSHAADNPTQAAAKHPTH